MSNNYEINYDDERFTDVEAAKDAALSENDALYEGMINDTDSYYQAQIDAANNWADTQSQLQQDRTDFTIEQIEQQKDQANKDYIKEQSGAYVDWQKQSNQYGANAEQMASAGMQNSGYSESSQVSMYNTYQNRVATARETYNRAILNYDNAIKDAQLQNNSALAEIAYQALQTSLELSLQGFQYKNSLLLDQANKKLEIDNIYYNRYQDVLNQMNIENSLAEEIRQYNQSYQLELDKFDESKRQFDASLAEEQRQFNESQKNSGSSGGSGSSGKTITKNSTSNAHGIDKKSSTELASDKSFEKQVLNLGYGPLSAQGLKDKVDAGQVQVTQNSNGSISVSKTNPLNSLLFSKKRF